MAGKSGPKAAPVLSNESATTMTSLPSDVIPISDITPDTAPCAFLGRVTSRGDLIQYTSKTSLRPGKLRSFIFQDRSGYIKAVAGNAAEDMHAPTLTRGAVVYVRLEGKNSVIPSNTTYNRTPHRFEVQFTPNTVVVPIPTTAPIYGSVPPAPSALTASQLLELLLVVEQVDDLSFIIVAATDPITAYTKNGADYKRSLFVMDETGGIEDLDIWGPSAQVAMKVGDIIHLSTVFAKRPKPGSKGPSGFTVGKEWQIKINPSTPRAIALQVLYQDLSNTNGDNSSSNDHPPPTDPPHAPVDADDRPGAEVYAINHPPPN